MKPAPELSVVIPAYNEAGRLPATLRRIIEYLEARTLSHEILVVDDGSSDATAERARETVGSSVTIVKNVTNRGKGFSVRRGMLLARGTRRLMTDADLSTPIEEIPRLSARMDEGHDIVIASRAVAGSVIEVHQPWYRENMGRVFNLLVRALVLPGLHDTQCGFKLFTAQAAETAFRGGRLDGFCFDVEALFLARKQGLKIAEVPVTWRNDTATRVRWASGIAAFLDVLRIRAYDLMGRYPARA